MSNTPWFDEAKKELGIREGRDDAEILRFFKEAGHPEVHSSEEAWCAAFTGAMLSRAGCKPSGSLMARSYEGYGESLNSPCVGCIAVLWRGSPHSSLGHVGFVVEAGGDFIKLLGGNQGAAGVVSIETFPKDRVLSYRWPKTGVLADKRPDVQSTAIPAPGKTMKSGTPEGSIGRPQVISTAKNSDQKWTDMNPLSILTTFVSAVLPKTAPGTPAAGIVTPIGQASSHLLSVAVGMLLAGLGATSFGADAIHTLSTIAGVLLAGLSAANHIGLLGANNANTEALAEQLLKQIADADKKTE